MLNLGAKEYIPMLMSADLSPGKIYVEMEGTLTKLLVQKHEWRQAISFYYPEGLFVSRLFVPTAYQIGNGTGWTEILPSTAPRTMEIVSFMRTLKSAGPMLFGNPTEAQETLTLAKQIAAQELTSRSEPSHEETAEELRERLIAAKFLSENRINNARRRVRR